MASAEVAVILPALNEAENLRALLPALLQLPVAQVIVIDDASHDDTSAVVRACTDARVVYHRNEVRLGLACSVLQGIRLARGSHVIVRDSDLSHSLESTRQLVAAAESGVDFCIASRYRENKNTVKRTNDIFSRLLNRALGGSLSDWTNGFFLLRTSRLNGLPLGWIFRGRGEYSIRLYRALLTRVTAEEIPTTTAPRGGGVSTTSTLRHGAAYLAAASERIPSAESARGQELQAAVEKWRRANGLAQNGHSRFGLRARQALLKDFQIASPALDLGCGNGAFVRQMFEKTQVDGIDQCRHQASAAQANGYRATWAADLHEPLPNLPENYRSVLCFETLQYLPWERLPGFFREVRAQCAGTAELHCLVPQRSSWLHRTRALLGLGKEDYRYHHDLSLLAAAATEAGWKFSGASQVAYGSRRVRELQPARPSRWAASALLSFRA